MKVKVIKEFAYLSEGTDGKYHMNVLKAGIYLRPTTDHHCNWNYNDKFFSIEFVLACADYFQIEYEIGDYVKKNDDHYSGQMTKGTIKQVKKLDERENTDLICFENEGFSFWLAEHFIPATLQETAEYNQAHEKLPYEYSNSIGDATFLARKSLDNKSVFIDKNNSSEHLRISLTKSALIEIARRFFDLELVERIK